MWLPMWLQMWLQMGLQMGLQMHACFIFPSPPNLGMSLQKMHSPHAGVRHAVHTPQRRPRLYPVPP